MCKTAWSHGIFVVTFCQITRASDFVLRKGKDHPHEQFLPVSQAELVPSTFPGPVPAPSLPLQSLLSQGEEQERLRWLSQGLVSSSNSVFAASHCPSSLLLGPPMASVPQGCPHLSLAPSVVSSPRSPAAPGVQQHTPFTTAFSQLCFQMFPAADGSFQVLPLWGHCSPPAVLG